MKLTEFLKPDFKKILILLILVSPLIALFLQGFFPAQFSFLNTLKSNYIVIAPFLVPLCIIFGGYGCWAVGMMDLPFWYEYVAIAGSLLIAILFWYFISCMIVLTGNKIFGYFGGSAKMYERMTKIFLISLFFIWGYFCLL